MRKEMPGAMPAELAEKLSDTQGWGDARSEELSYQLWLEEECERSLKDSGWWLDVLEGSVASNKIAFALSEIYRNLGNQEEVRKQLSDLFHWAYLEARDEAEDR